MRTAIAISFIVIVFTLTLSVLLPLMGQENCVKIVGEGHRSGPLGPSSQYFLLDDGRQIWAGPPTARVSTGKSKSICARR